MKLAIIIPARYHSTRLPGKPLAKIAGKTMLQRVSEIAQAACADIDGAVVYVATEDQRIAEHAQSLGISAIMTSDQCKTGSDRTYQAVASLSDLPDFVINLQGDAPLTPPEFIRALLLAACENKNIEVVTPVVQLTWQALDQLRANKKKTPFSGTTAILNQNNDALWFSKNIIPAMRKEAQLREHSTYSSVYQHVGLYGYRYDILERFVNLPESHYEAVEGLEQLRFLENNIKITAVPVKLIAGAVSGGVDSPEDIERVETHIHHYGEILS
ncbi:3-deoxy-manno-octulosonate cytidylyltransferase [Piscirickettsia salmonis]|uniref:3-deoxy-manno-octulosonate cytidylyltransferase n=1 Tax=Piscirickettsia salmonis TaxID=1238 RepID=UPI0012B8E1B3|nr:3-deoxy-manno-octulosonate cytidylyltransferase [Piscirickettsia salmonis]QGP51278.1 3-deoxy-manno-octulosonate cytidylyltransferase [Piscirickettsia salmonis]